LFVSSILFGLGLLKWIQRNLETSTQSLLQKEISGDLFIKQIMIELVRDFVGNLKILNFQNARFLSLICFFYFHNKVQYFDFRNTWILKADIVVSTTDFYFEQQIGNYHILKKIGNGKFGLVKLGENKKTHQKVAIKIIDKSFLNVVDKNSIITEAEVMTYLRHPNVIQLYEVIENEKEICMVMEYAAGGDLHDYVCKSKGKKLKENEAKRLFHQIISGVSYCHRHYIVHRDLKAENIFLDEFQNVKIGDWGFSSEFHPGSKMETYCGSLDYAAPEILSGVAYVGPEVDIWSLGK
jgi:serine/threonine protein kinase